MMYPDQITPDEALQIADRATRYIWNAYYGVVRDTPDEIAPHPFVQEDSYALVAPRCHVQAFGRSVTTQRNGVLSQYMDIVSEQIDRYWMPNGQRVVTVHQLMLAHWLTYPIALDELTPPPLLERATRPSDRRAYRTAYKTLAPLRNFSDIPQPGEQIALASVWLDVFHHNSSVQFLQTLEQVLDHAGLEVHDIRMGKVSPYIIRHLLALAQEAGQQMGFDPELPVAWQQGRFAQTFLDLFHARRDVLQRLITTVDVTHSKRSASLMHRIFLR